APNGNSKRKPAGSGTPNRSNRGVPTLHDRPTEAGWSGSLLGNALSPFHQNATAVPFGLAPSEFCSLKGWGGDMRTWTGASARKRKRLRTFAAGFPGRDPLSRRSHKEDHRA